MVYDMLTAPPSGVLCPQLSCHKCCTPSSLCCYLLPIHALHGRCNLLTNAQHPTNLNHNPLHSVWWEQTRVQGPWCHSHLPCSNITCTFAHAGTWCWQFSHHHCSPLGELEETLTTKEPRRFATSQSRDRLVDWAVMQQEVAKIISMRYLDLPYASGLCWDPKGLPMLWFYWTSYWCLGRTSDSFIINWVQFCMILSTSTKYALCFHCLPQ